MIQSCLKSFFTLCCFCFLNTTISMGQVSLLKGYYLAKPDSARVEGYFHLMDYMFGYVGYYESDKKEKQKDLTPDDVYLIETEQGNLILPVSVKHKEGVNSIFVNKVLASDVTLFEGKILGKEDVYFVKHDTATTLSRINKSATKTFLSVYLGSQCGPKNDIKYTRSGLMSAFRQYARCKGFQVEKPARNRFLLDISVGAHLGYYTSKPDVSGFYSDNFNTVNDWLGGGELQFGLMRKLYLRSGFYMEKFTILKEEGALFSYSFRGWPFKFKDPFQFSYKSYEIPIELVWYANKTRRISPLFGVGISYVKSTNPIIEKQFIRPIDYDPDFYSFTLEDILHSLDGKLTVRYKWNRALQMRLGAIFRFKNHSFLETSARYMKRQEFFDLTTPVFYGEESITHRNWLDFSLSYHFPLVYQKRI